jgi:hypothetical protein
MTEANEGKPLPEEFLDTAEVNDLSLAYCLFKSCFDDLDERDHQLREGCSVRRAEDMKRREKGTVVEGEAKKE